MQRTYRVPLARAGLVGLMAIALLLAHPGTSIAGDASKSNRAAAGTGAALQRGAGYEAVGQRPGVRALQRTLRRLGWRPGGVDGLFGPQTESAVKRLQRAAGLAADGIVGSQTRRELRALRANRLTRGSGYAVRGGSRRVRRLQRELRRRGLRPGPVDGRFGPQTERAVARLQQAAGLPAHGAVDRPTKKLLARAEGAPARPGGVGQSSRSATAERPRASLQASAALAMPADIAPDPVSEPGGPAPGALVLGAGLVLLLGAFAGLMLARTRMLRPGIAVPLAPGVVVEGEAPSVGSFRGPVEALILGRRAFRRKSVAQYLVTTADKESRFWVTHSDVRRLEATVGQADPQRSDEPRSERVRALGYASVPDPAPDEPGQLRDQAGRIDSYCQDHGWQLLEVVHDKDDGNGRALARPGLIYALDQISRGRAACLVVTRLERLTRSTPDLGRVIEAVRRSGGWLIVMDVGLDTASSQAITDQLNDEGAPTINGARQARPPGVQVAAGYQRPPSSEGGST
jgi:peptidoglycan hydrolase-like protein with peptidoglycan-binding domain